jgi:hypothetical protein
MQPTNMGCVLPSTTHPNDANIKILLPWSKWAVCARQHMSHAPRLPFRYDRVNMMKCLGNFHVPIQSWQCNNIPKGLKINTLCIMLTSACYTQCIHAFRPHISMQIFTHNPIPSKRIRSSLAFYAPSFCVLSTLPYKNKEKEMWCACDTL